MPGGREKRGANNLYQRNGAWYARVQVNGCDVRKSLGTRSRAKAKKRLAKVLDEIEHVRFYGEERHTWKAAKGKWLLEYAPGNVKPRTLKRYQTSLKQLEPYLDDLYQDEINRRKIAEIVSGRIKLKVTNATIRRDLTAVSSVLAACVAWGWREDNPAREWDRSAIKERRDPIILPAPEDIDYVVSKAPTGLAKMIRWAQYTGMREEECASLGHSQIDERRKAAELTKTKTNRPRVVPLDDRALGTYAGTPRYLNSSYVFWHGEGERYLYVDSQFGALCRRLQAKAKKTGKRFRRFKFHDLRHWYAVDYLRRYGDIYTLQKILGHTSVKTTEIYLQYLTPEEQETATRPAQKPAQV